MTSQSVFNLIPAKASSSEDTPKVAQGWHDVVACASPTDKDQLAIDQPQQLIRQLADLGPNGRYGLFLDIDGTLADFCNNPAHSVIPQATLSSIKTILDCQIPVIAVTGRSIEVAQQLFAPLCLPIAGLHGLEIWLNAQTRLSPDLGDIDFVALKHSLQQFCQKHPRLRLEDKTHSLALHYRESPELEAVAQHVMQQLVVQYPHMKLNHGKCVVEILPKQADKGAAITTITRQLGLTHSTAIFIGDDRTDESGFCVVNAQQGMSIKVGSGTTHANYRLENTRAVAEFLAQFAQFLSRCAVSHRPLGHAQA